MRSEPLGWSDRVISTWQNRRATSAIRGSSVATMMSDSVLAFWHCSTTCWMSGLPAMGWMGLPGNRVEAHPAIAPLARFVENAADEERADPSFTHRRAHVEPLHLADVRVSPGPERDASLRNGAVRREKERATRRRVVSGKRRHLALEVLERQIESQGVGVFQKEPADGLDVLGRLRETHGQRTVTRGGRHGAPRPSPPERPCPHRSSACRIRRAS